MAAVRRFAFAIVGTVALAAAVVGALRLLGDSQHLAIDGAAGIVVASLVWLPVTRRWNARGHLCWSSTIFLFVVYLAFVLKWTFDSHLGLASTAGGLLLWLLELFAAHPRLRLPVGDLRRARIGALAPPAEQARAGPRT